MKYDPTTGGNVLEKDEFPTLNSVWKSRDPRRKSSDAVVVHDYYVGAGKQCVEVNTLIGDNFTRGDRRSMTLANFRKWYRPVLKNDGSHVFFEPVVVTESML